MSKQDKFFFLPTEPVPVNRRVYAAAKKPFSWLWQGLTDVTGPWRTALPWAMLAAVGISLLQYAREGLTTPVMHAVVSTGAVGLVWTLYLGALIAIIKVLQR